MSVQPDESDVLPGVGITALVTAAARAVETNRPDGLVTDPFAEAFVRHADLTTPMPTRLGTVTTASSEFDQLWDTTALAVGVRTVFFDDYFAATCRAGVRQVVLLAAGLDTRAFRLGWPVKTVVFELDTRPVLEFKHTVLTKQGARPRCDRRPVLSDLFCDWTADLTTAGFDPATPTAWLAEGILPYLSAEDEAALLHTVDTLSPSGSTIAFDHVLDSGALRDDARRGRTQYSFDLEAMFSTKTGWDPSNQLRGAGWSVSGMTGEELVARHGRTPGEHTRRDLADKSRFEIATLK